MKQLVFYDDTWRGIPEFQRSLLPSVVEFERALLPAAAASAVVDSVVICRQLPSPVEVRHAITLIGAHSFDVLALSKGNWLNVCDLDSDDHWQLYFEQSKVERSIAASDVKSTGIITELASSRDTLVLPYQTLEWHCQKFGNKAILCDPADALNNKAFVANLLAEGGLASHVSDGFLVGPDNPEGYVRRIIECVDRWDSLGVASYIKLSQRGVSGLANVVPVQYPDIYRSSVPLEERVTLLRQVLAERGIDASREQARVERRLSKRTDYIGPLEFTVGGILVEGIFYPCYLGRNINSSADATSRMIHGSEPASVGLQDAAYGQLIHVAQRIATSLASVGYRTGYSYFDIVVTSDGALVATDFNMRRGLRSAGEAWLSVCGGAYLSTTLTVRDAFDATQIPRLVNALEESGAVWYGSSSLAATGIVPILVPADANDMLEAIDGQIRSRLVGFVTD
ncbi:hypothetical protein [Amycolatopsis magusensis]|uniref:hypothetical protein n=1 Tax=Amycolatopsis magusensis TaxID=882444 RepID=UPI0024A9A211|nr:hypothetical protein [Amycolatopsis magusensis]MDI5982534.1 hypothetical protein [Amycolatopsis magusensis]